MDELDKEVESDGMTLTDEMSDLDESLAKLDADMAAGDYEAAEADEAHIQEDEALLTVTEAELESVEADELLERPTNFWTKKTWPHWKVRSMHLSTFYMIANAHSPFIYIRVLRFN